MQEQPYYPFFTCWQEIYFVGYFALDSSLRFKLADSAAGATIGWDTMERCPNFLGTELFAGEQVIPEAAFRAALQVAKHEIAEFVHQRLPVVPVVYATGAQTTQILALASHPLVSRRERTKALLIIDKLTTADADEYIAMLTAHIAEMESSREYTVTGEAFLIDTKAA